MFWVADEVAAWPGVNGLRQWEVMASGTGARQEPPKIPKLRLMWLHLITRIMFRRKI